MNKETAYNLIRLGQEIAKEGLDDDTFNKMLKLRRAVLKLHRFCERYCNEAGFNPDLIDKQQERIKAMVDALPVFLGLKIENIQNDPRGWEVKFNNYFFNQFVYGC